MKMLTFHLEIIHCSPEVLLQDTELPITLFGASFCIYLAAYLVYKSSNNYNLQDILHFKISFYT